MHGTRAAPAGRGPRLSAPSSPAKTELEKRVRHRRVARRHHQPPDRRPARGRRQQVRTRDLRRQACAADQRLLLPARRGPAGVRRPARRDPCPGEAALGGPARDRRGHARRRAHRGVNTPPRVVLGVAGGIAAYKACLLLRLLTETGHDVTVVPTASALEFVGAPTWAALSGRPVTSSVWDGVEAVPHVRLGREADLVVVAPATADLLARAAHGLADDLLTNTLLTARCPVLLAPAMHTEMWLHPATQANVATLRSRGVVVLDPASGRLTGPDTGPGRLPEPDAIFAAAQGLLRRGGPGPDLAGRHVVVSAGGTREPLDPVRYLGNRSSGRQGYALATTAAAGGARVTLVAANSELPAPAGVNVARVGTAEERRQAMHASAAGADAIVMAAAVADFRPADVAVSKIKKTD